MKEQIENLKLLEKFPKLPDQDDYLLDLQNNAYSIKTIHNYARDLCIFSVFLHFRNVILKNLSKKDVSLYKGYLTSGEHLKDLDKIREGFVEKPFVVSTNDGKSPGGDLTNDSNSNTVYIPSDVNENSSKGTGVFENDFLRDVYSKVYGSLGILERPLNSRSRSENGLDVRSINRMLSALRSYLKFRIEWDLDIPLAPDAIKLLKGDKKVKKVASIEELISLIESPMEFEKDDKVALRNRCMLEMLFATGMRISELINLDISQLNVEGKLYIKGKGKKERIIYVTPRAMDWLNKYLKLRLMFAFTDKGNDEQPGEIDKLFSDLGVDNKELVFCETSGDEG